MAAGRTADAEPLFRELIAKADSAHIPPAQVAAFQVELDQCLAQLHKAESARVQSSVGTTTQPTTSLTVPSLSIPGASGTATATRPTR
jgi:hypothetical protein